MGDAMPRSSPWHERPIVVLSLPLARRPSHPRSRPLSDGLHGEASPLRRGLCQRHWEQRQDSGAGFAKGIGNSAKIGRPMGRGGHMPAEISTPWLIGVSLWERGMQC